MNSAYKVIWNEVSETFVAVSELAKGRSKSVSTAIDALVRGFEQTRTHFFIKPLIAALICIGFTFATYASPLSGHIAPPATNQLPTGAQLSAGSATVSQTGAVMTVNQSSQNASINWQTFNVGSQASVNFVQPSSTSVALNRVLDNNPSQIFGKINANGSVFLENPNGVYFAPGSSVDTGSFLATTANITDSDLMSGNYTFNRNAATGKIVNKGTITSALGGYIALLAPEVRNLGVVVAKGGTIVLAAGETYQLQFESNNTLTNVLVSPGTVAAYIKNGNAVEAPGGLVILSAQAANAIQGGVVKNTGTISADGLVSDGGVIRLVASSSITNTGTISANAAPHSSGSGGQITLKSDLSNPKSQTNVDGLISAKGGELGGDGGTVETSGDFVHVFDSAQINTQAPKGTGGTWIVDPWDFTVGTGGDISGSTLSANLSNSSVTILSSGGGTGTSGNININDSVSWTGSNKLTLSAANNINIDNSINVPTGGSVSLRYATSIGTGGYNFGTFGVNNEGFSGSINYAGTGAGIFTTQAGSGSVISYTVINNPSVYSASTNPTGEVRSNKTSYALGQNYSFGSSFTSSPINNSYAANFDGLGHTVSNLSGTGSIGLFNTSSGSIQNIGVNMSTSNAGNNTGGLVNTNTGTITNTFANVSISSNSNNTTGTFGGLVGNNSGLITNSFSTGTITGGGTLGGLIGLNTGANSAQPSNILNSFSTANVTGTAAMVGGLIGENTTSGSGASATVTGSFSTGSVYGVSGAPYPYGVGGLIGYNYAGATNSTVAILNSYSSSIVLGPSFASAAYNYAGLVGNNLANFANSIANITSSFSTGSVNSYASSIGGLIGTNSAAATGSSANLLNVYSSSNVNNTITKPVTSAANTGGLVGANSAYASGASATVTSSYATGSVSGNNNVGGLLGSNAASSGGNTAINSSYSTSALSISGTTAGGLVGSNTVTGNIASKSTVSSSYATGSLSVMSGAAANAQNNFAGLIGANSATGTTNNNVSIDQSYATGNITVPGGSSGGLIGSNASTGQGKVTNSYATGNVTTTTGSNVGGLIGSNTSNLPTDSSTAGNVSLNNNYASGSVSGTSSVGGLIGYNLVAGTNGNGSITASYSSGNVTGTAADVGGLVGQNIANANSANVSISSSYVTSQTAGILVQGTSSVGGLVGLNSAPSASSNSSITSAYSTAQVSGSGASVGGLIGSNASNASSANASITTSYATGAVSGANYIGGLIGNNNSSNGGGSNVSNSYATGNVSGTTGIVGGLLGNNAANTSGTSSSSNILNSYASGNVTNTSGTYVGGFIGQNYSAGSGNSSSITGSYSTGTVISNGSDVGGLVGYDWALGNSPIIQSYSTGNVSTTLTTAINLGGLIGYMYGGPSGSSSSIKQSYATGNVSGPGYSTGGFGGFVGQVNANSGTVNIDQSYSTGSVQMTGTGAFYAGGFIGSVPTSGSTSSVNITNSYATGSVNGSAGNFLGGFIGQFLSATHGSISNSYEIGSVSGSTHLGGFLGAIGAATTLQNNFWNKTNNSTLSATSGGVGATSTATNGILGMTTTDMQTISNFSSRGWDTNSIWTYLSYFNNQLPFLKQNNTLATITLVSGLSTYGSTPALSYSITNSFGNAITSPTASGTPVWSLTSNGVSMGNQALTNTTNAGVYSLTYSSGITLGNYTIVSGSAENWTISKAPLGISVVGTYSGTTSVSPTSYSLTGLLNGQTLMPTLVTISDANVATNNKYVTAISTSTGTANLANYQITNSVNATPSTTSTNTATLNPIALSVTEVASLSGNIYKGSAYTGTYTTSAMVQADQSLISVTGVASGTDAGTYTSNLAVSLTGSAQTNYTNPSITNANLVVSPKTITVTNNSLTSTYDGVSTYSNLASQTNYTNTALVGSDSLAGVTQTASLTGTAIAQAGNYTVTPSAAQLTSGNSSNYQFTYVASTNTVSPLNLNVASTSVSSKTYDGSTTASLSGGTLTGVLAPDIANVTLLQAGTFASANAGTAIAVTATDTLGGTAAGNYSVTQPTGLAANITPKSITITGQTGVNKIYDTTTSATLAGGVLSGVIGNDQLTLNQQGTFASKDAGNGISITPQNSLATSGAYLNYTLVQPTYPLTANITPAVLTVSGLAATSKTYDGTTSANLTGSATAQPLGADVVTVSGAPIGNYADPNAGTHKFISVTGFVMDGVDKANYTLVGLHGVYGDITPATLTVTGLTANNKVYDSTTLATFSGGSISGVIGKDQVFVNSGTFASKNVGNGVAATAVLTGDQALNYTATGLTGYSANITPLSLSITNQVAANKVYDSTTTASLSGGTLSGVYSGDSVSLTQAGDFSSKNVGTSISIVASNSLSGTDASNYSITQPTSLTANITKATLSVSGLTAVDKVYDSTRAAIITGTPSVTALGSDVVSLQGSAVGSFIDQNVGSNKAVSVSGLSLTSTDSTANNYTLNGSPILTASITPRHLTVTGSSVTNKVYDATTAATLTGGTLVGLQGSDTFTLTQAGTFDNKNVGTLKNVTPIDSISSTNGSLTSNYNLIQPTGLQGSITPATLSVTGLTVSDKFYDGTNTAYIVGTPVAQPLGNDTVTISGNPNATFSSVNAGLHIPVNVDNITLSGTDSGNYIATNLAGLSATIKPAPLNASVNPYTKVYDGTTAASPTLTITSGLVGTETLVATGSGALDSKNVVEASQVTISAVTLANGTNGGLASNYVLVPGQIGVATVTPAPLTASVTAPNKVYDGTTTATPTLAIRAGLIGSETLNVTGSGDFNSKDVVTAKLITVNSINLADGSNGGLASNYSLANGQTVAGMITPASITATVAAANSVYGAAITPGAASLTGVIGSDAVVASSAISNPTYSTSNNLKAGSYNQVVNLSGNDASNYSVGSYTNSTPNYTVTPLAIMATSIETSTSTYGTAPSAGAVNLSGVVPGDLVSGVATPLNPTYSTSNNLSAGVYNQSANSLIGADAANYVLTPYTTSSPNLTVTPATITASVAAANSVYGSTVTPGSVTFAGVQNGDLVSGSGAVVNPGYSSSNNLRVGTYNQSVSSISGLDSANYVLTPYTTPTPNYTVNVLALTGSISASSSQSGASIAPGVATLTNVIPGDVVSASSISVNIPGSSPNSQVANTTGTFPSSQSVSSLNGVDASNYSYANIKGDYSVKTGFSSGSVYPSAMTSQASSIPTSSKLTQLQSSISGSNASKNTNAVEAVAANKSASNPNSKSKTAESEISSIPLAKPSTSISKNNQESKPSSSTPSPRTSSVQIARNVDNNFNLSIIPSAQAQEIPTTIADTTTSAKINTSNDVSITNGQESHASSEPSPIWIFKSEWVDKAQAIVLKPENLQAAGEVAATVTASIQILSVALSTPIPPIRLPLPLPSSPVGQAIARLPLRIPRLT
jgi:filamentous hemagglutinin family protein